MPQGDTNNSAKNPGFVAYHLRLKGITYTRVGIIDKTFRLEFFLITTLPFSINQFNGPDMNFMDLVCTKEPAYANSIFSGRERLLHKDNIFPPRMRPTRVQCMKYIPFFGII